MIFSIIPLLIHFLQLTNCKLSKMCIFLYTPRADLQENRASISNSRLFCNLTREFIQKPPFLHLFRSNTARFYTATVHHFPFPASKRQKIFIRINRPNNGKALTFWQIGFIISLISEKNYSFYEAYQEYSLLKTKKLRTSKEQTELLWQKNFFPMA